jgi:hypothetical protein
MTTQAKSIMTLFFPLKGKQYELCSDIPNIYLHVSYDWRNQQTTQDKWREMGLTQTSSGGVLIPKGTILSCRMVKRDIIYWQIAKKYNKDTGLSGTFTVKAPDCYGILLCEYTP